MADPFLGQIIAVAFKWVPEGWAACDGSPLSIGEHPDLYNLLGLTYGGDGISTFRLPDLRGRVAVGLGQGPGLPDYPLGQSGSAENVTLTKGQLGAHKHQMIAVATPGTTDTPNSDKMLGANAQTKVNMYATGVTPDVSLSVSALALSDGGYQPHENLQPFIVLNYIINVTGVYPIPPND